MTKIPVLGRVAAGKPSEYLPIIKWRYIRPIKGARPGERHAAVQVQGDSMEDDHIIDGDYVIFLMTHEARAGELAVILTPDGSTVKYVYPQSDGTVLLEGAAEWYVPQVWEGAEVRVQGVVKRIERDL
jgi:repressor LexA